MRKMQLVKWIMEFSIIKTLYINLYYFRFLDAIKLPVIVSRNLKIDKLEGILEIKHKSFACVRLGFKSLTFFDNNRSKSIWHNTGKIEICNRATFGNGFKILVNRNATLKIGDNFHLSGESTIIVNHYIEIGDNCLFSWDILLMDTDFHKIYYCYSDTQINNDKAIYIGNSCWIGCRTLILKGSRIPNYSIIAANTLVSKIKFKEHCIYGGPNCELIKSNVRWTF